MTAAPLVPCGTSILLAALLLAACSCLLRAQAPVRSAPVECLPDPSSVQGQPRSSDIPPVYTAPLPPAISNRLKLDEARLMGILAREPGNPGALAGMGWIRSQQGNFLAAISFLEQARLKRPNDRTLAVALDLDRFRFLIGEARYALASNDPIAAQKRYLEAMHISPNNREASAGLNATRIRISAARPPTNSGCPMITESHRHERVQPLPNPLLPPNPPLHPPFRTSNLENPVKPPQPWKTRPQPSKQTTSKIKKHGQLVSVNLVVWI